MERLIRFVKDNFLAGRVFGTITELNLEAIGWCKRQNSIYHKAVDCIPCEKHQEDCTGGTAACTAKAVCQVCGRSYGNLDPDNHINLTEVEAVAATQQAEGNTAYWYCEDCGRYFADADACL